MLTNQLQDVWDYEDQPFTQKGKEPNKIQKKERGKPGEYATAGPTGHNIEWNPWICVCGSWMCSASRSSSHAVGTGSAQRALLRWWGCKKCLIFQGCLGLSRGREGTNKSITFPMMERIAEMPWSIWRWAMVRGWTQSSFIIKYLSHSRASTVLPGSVGLCVQSACASLESLVRDTITPGSQPQLHLWGTKVNSHFVYLGIWLTVFSLYVYF